VDPTASPAEAELRFEVMGTHAHVRIVGGDAAALADAACARLHNLEARWSRFRPDSEISRLNRLDGAPAVVSAPTIELIAHAIEGWKVSDGNFDPTMLGDVIRAGYDRSYEQLQDDATPAGETGAVERGEQWWHRDCGGIQFDRATNMVQLPVGVGFDPGGIGKGFAADLVVTAAMAAGAAGALVNVGGDLRVTGQPPSGPRWLIDVLDPFNPAAVVATVGLVDGAVATSTRVRRTWTRDGRPQHHLLDTRSGEPAGNGVAAVSVIASEGWRAEVLAKAAFIAGVDAARTQIESKAAAALLITDSGTVIPIGAWNAFAITKKEDATI
jgi:thiamine biosynthesis lipoprotein